MSIQRIEANYTNGWRVAQKGFSKLFSDSKYGGKKKAFKAAEEFNKTLPSRRTPPAYSIETHPELFAQIRRKSGVVGISGTIMHSGGRVQYLWSASKYSHKTRKTRHFSISKYGPLALQMAIETRQSWDEEQKKGNIQTAGDEK